MLPGKPQKYNFNNVASSLAHKPLITPDPRAHARYIRTPQHSLARNSPCSRLHAREHGTRYGLTHRGGAYQQSRSHQSRLQSRDHAETRTPRTMRRMRTSNTLLAFRYALSNIAGNVHVRQYLLLASASHARIQATPTSPFIEPPKLVRKMLLLDEEACGKLPEEKQVLCVLQWLQNLPQAIRNTRKARRTCR